MIMQPLLAFYITFIASATESASSQSLYLNFINEMAFNNIGDITPIIDFRKEKEHDSNVLTTSKEMIAGLIALSSFNKSIRNTCNSGNRAPCFISLFGLAMVSTALLSSQGGNNYKSSLKTNKEQNANQPIEDKL